MIPCLGRGNDRQVNTKRTDTGIHRQTGTGRQHRQTDRHTGPISLVSSPGAGRDLYHVSAAAVNTAYTRLCLLLSAEKPSGWVVMLVVLVLVLVLLLLLLLLLLGRV